MSLIRQIWLLMLATVLLAYAGSVTVAVESARGYLQTQLRLKNADNATSLALALSLAALVILFYVVTLVKGPIVLVRPL